MKLCLEVNVTLLLVCPVSQSLIIHIQYSIHILQNILYINNRQHKHKTNLGRGIHPNLSHQTIAGYLNVFIIRWWWVYENNSHSLLSTRVTATYHRLPTQSKGDFNTTLLHYYYYYYYYSFEQGSFCHTKGCGSTHTHTRTYTYFNTNATTYKQVSLRACRHRLTAGDVCVQLSRLHYLDVSALQRSLGHVEQLPAAGTHKHRVLGQTYFMYVCMYVCMYVYFNKWRSDRVLVRLGLNTLIGWLHVVR